MEKRDILGYEGIYQATKCGKIWHKTKKFYLKQQNSGKGYLKVNLSKNGKRKSHFVHRLVLETFVENINKLTDVDHIDFNRANNRLNNLRWITRSENVKRTQFRRKKFIPDCETFYIKDMKNNGMTLKQIAKIYECSQTAIYNVLKR